MKKNTTIRPYTRCNSSGVTPYLKRWGSTIIDRACSLKRCSPAELEVLDIGSGNGRNSRYFNDRGIPTVGIDHNGDTSVHNLRLGHDRLPLPDQSMDIILLQFVYMFLTVSERLNLLREIKRVASPHCMILVELYPAKHSYAPTKKECQILQKQLYDQLGWLHYKWHTLRFIASKS